MKMFLLALFSVFFSVAAQFSLKAGISYINSQSMVSQIYSINWLYSIFTNLHIITGLLLYGSGAVIWLGVLSQWDVSKAYPIVGLGFVFTVIVGFLLGEDISFVRVLGVILISTGVLLVGNS